MWFSCPFVLKQKDQKFKADIIGPTAQCGRFPAMSAWPARPAQSGVGVPGPTGLYSRPQPHRGLDPRSPIWLGGTKKTDPTEVRSAISFIKDYSLIHHGYRTLLNKYFHRNQRHRIFLQRTVFCLFVHNTP